MQLQNERRPFKIVISYSFKIIKFSGGQNYTSTSRGIYQLFYNRLENHGTQIDRLVNNQCFKGRGGLAVLGLFWTHYANVCIVLLFCFHQKISFNWCCWAEMLPKIFWNFDAAYERHENFSISSADRNQKYLLFSQLWLLFHTAMFSMKCQTSDAICNNAYLGAWKETVTFLGLSHMWRERFCRVQ